MKSCDMVDRIDQSKPVDISVQNRPIHNVACFEHNFDFNYNTYVITGHCNTGTIQILAERFR